MTKRQTQDSRRPSATSAIDSKIEERRDVSSELRSSSSSFGQPRDVPNLNNHAADDRFDPVEAAMNPAVLLGTELLSNSERLKRQAEDFRSYEGPDGVLLWAPQGRFPERLRDDPRLRWLVAEHPDLREWQRWGYRWLSVVYDRAYRDTTRRTVLRKQVAGTAAMQATAKLKVFFSSYLCQEIEGRWKHPDWRENPKSMLTPPADLQAEIALRADFWNVCCKPLLRLKEREFGYKQHLSEQAANLSSTVAAFLSFIADALNREGGDDGPVKYRNPFSVFNRGGTPIALGDGSKVAKTRKSADKTFAWMEHRCPQLLDWRAFAIEYVAQLRVAVPSALSGLGLFFEVYLSGAGQASACLEGVSPAMVRSPTEYLARSNRLPDTFKVVSSNIAGNRAVVDFLDWLLLHHFSADDDHGEPIILAAYRNPLTPIEASGTEFRRRTVREAMPYLWIERLRLILVEGEHFCHWKWAYSPDRSHRTRGDSSDWFEVPESRIDKNDPDCVWRVRVTSRGDRYKERTFYEMWSPARSVVLLTKLTTSLRTLQVRMLDSGESDEWRFDIRSWAEQSTPWVLNDLDRMNPDLRLSLSRDRQAANLHARVRSPVEGWSNGVLRRVPEYKKDGLAYGSVLYANTNKTADAQKEGAAKGFELPLPIEPCPVIVSGDGRLSRPSFTSKKDEYLWLVALSRNIYYWLAKMRDWQAKYNPIDRRTKWKELDGSGLIDAKSDEQFAMYPDACFLFREPAIKTGKEHKDSWPMSQSVMAAAWWALCKELQDRFAAEGKTQNGEFIRLVDNDKRLVNSCTYDLHAIRVSLVTAWIVDGEIEPDVVMLLTGHSRLVMLLYYNARKLRSAQEAVSKGQERIDEKKAQRELEFIRNAEIDEILKVTAFNSADAVIEAIGGESSARRFAGWMRMPEGFCPVGGNTVRILDSAAVCGCFNGGVAVKGGGGRYRDFGPVEGGDHNCPNCRWFITTPSHLEALTGKFNVTSYLMTVALEKARSHEKELHEFEGELYEAGERRASDAVQAEFIRKIERAQVLAERYGAEYVTLATTLLNTKRLIDRLLIIQRERGGSEVSEALVLSGGEAELKVILEQTDSELLQLQLVSESYAIHPEFDPGEAIWRRSQILDAALVKEGKAPFFLQLSKEDQVHAANEFMLRIGRIINPASPGNGLLEGIIAIEAGKSLGNVLGLTKDGLHKMLVECKGAPKTKVFQLTLDRSGPELVQVSGGVGATL